MAPPQKGFSWSNIAVGAAMNMFEVTTLGQPFEVIKTQMASNRSQSMAQALSTVWSRGGVLGFYQGLIPWGAVLLFTSTEVQKVAKTFGLGPGAAGLAGGMTGGIVQAYATMGFCTCMKTAEITRVKQMQAGEKPKSTWAVFADIYRREGIRGINKGVNAVAVRQCTNWGSRMGFARLAEAPVRKMAGKSEKDKLSPMERILCSSIGGALATWNQPIEVIRVETAAEHRPAKPTIMNTAAYIYKENGIKGLYRGVSPRILLGVWQTVCMVSFADTVRDWMGTSSH
ncbi:uncharacterized protein MJAP1_003461 [Malassezia japonica]|uniref:Mitochondrial carrier n=1 Tax=Malassezia japonica TaxID=223818 RepID=A0AAF0F436_9BASI|nr:uncharacterized protein MJAP1_003461 [Malassezia japonica]WFD40475.1 hypothetical protein MJAP1_003461 [Malassezia japonica]